MKVLILFIWIVGTFLIFISGMLYTFSNDIQAVKSMREVL